MQFKHKVLVSALAATLVAVFGCASGASDSSSTPATDNPYTLAPVSSPPVASVSAPSVPLTSFGDGTFSVGTASGNVAPGTYQTTVPAKSVGCYWVRMSDLSGELSAIIANELGQPNQQMMVTIAVTDVGFKSRGCGKWTKQ